MNENEKNFDQEEIKDFPKQTTFNTDDMTTTYEEVNDDGVCCEND